MTHATLALVHLASPARLLRLGLHPPRLPPLRRVDHRPGPQRRGAHHHPVRPGPGAARRLEGPGVLRRVRRLARRPRHPQPDPPGRDGPRPALARLPRLGRRRHQGPSQQPPRLGHLHLPRVHRPLPQPGHHRPGPQLGRPRAPCSTNPEKPAWFLPISGRLYFRKSQLPERPGQPGRSEPFRTKCELAVELFREQARLITGQSPGRLRRRLRPAQRGPAAGPAPRTARPASSS